MRTAALGVLLAGCAHRGHDEEEPPAPAEEAAECCLGAKWWEASADGWGSPRMGTVVLEPGKFHPVSVTLTKDLHFRFEACGDPSVTEVDLLLYDPDGNVLVRDEQPGREPRMTWVAPTRGPRSFVVFLRETGTGGPGAVSWLYASHDEE